MASRTIYLEDPTPESHKCLQTIAGQEYEMGEKEEQRNARDFHFSKIIFFHGEECDDLQDILLSAAII